MKQGVLVIGNGFDLDLGLKTSFNNIFSEWDPHEDIQSSLLYELVCSRTGDEWNLLKRNIRKIYSSDRNLNFHKIVNDDKCHKEMIWHIISYLECMDKTMDEDSYAYRLINSIRDNGKFSIYSFNYTDSVERCTNLSVNHVHGKYQDNSVILGTEDNETADRGLCFLQKSFSPYYESSDLKYELNKCDTIIFFGHSLGKADYLYFQDFFKKQSKEGLPEEADKKKIVIFTYNEESRRNILFQLFSMNEHRLDRFYQQNDFEVILTCKDDPLQERYEQRFEELLSYLNRTSRAADQSKIHNIAQFLG